MNYWNAFPFVRYSLALIAGILLAFWFPQLWTQPVITGLSLLLPILVTAFVLRHRYITVARILSGLFSLSMIAFLGGYLLLLNDQRVMPDHYAHVEERILAFAGKINSDHYEREKYHRYIFELDELLTEEQLHAVRGSIYLYVRKDSFPSTLAYGTKLYVNGSFHEISEPANPDQFNYQEYLARKHIFGQAFVSPEAIDSVGYEPSSEVLNFAYRTRSRSSQMIADFIPGKAESAVMNALLIGVKDFLDNDLKEAYSAAGAMHVLAVSGLHVGIVYLLVTIVFGQLKRTGWGKIFFVIVSLLIIWGYALITGFSPSVMRASTMFSIIVMGEASKRKSNIYNSLGLAAFVLLLYNPYFVFDVGFQLSFIAVLGIVTFQPPIYRLWQPNNPFLDYLWAIVTVSIAAQLVTSPLSVLYFNQLPTYFLISNIIIIPAAMVMLTTGLFMLAVGSFSMIAGETIGFLLGSFVQLVNWLILKIQLLPFSAVDWIYLSSISVVLIYLFMLYFFFSLKLKNFGSFAFSLICLALLILNFQVEDYHKTHQKRILVYQSDEHLAIDLIHGSNSKLISTSQQAEIHEIASFNINPHRLISGLNKIGEAQVYNFDQTTSGIYMHVWEGMKILVVSPDADLQTDQTIETDLLVLQSFKPELIDAIRASHLILAQMSQWERQKAIEHLEQKKIEYFDMFEQGYFELDLNQPISRKLL